MSKTSLVCCSLPTRIDQVFSSFPGKGGFRSFLLNDSEIVGGRRLFMRLPFLKQDRPITVRLHVDLGFDSGRLVDLIQLLARQDAILRDLETDRTLYHLGMPERFADVTFLVANKAHKDRILKTLAAGGFSARLLADPK